MFFIEKGFCVLFVQPFKSNVVLLKLFWPTSCCQTGFDFIDLAGIRPGCD